MIFYDIVPSVFGSFCTSLIASLGLGYCFIAFFRSRVASKVRDYVPENHSKKNGTPTMGGLFILGAIIINTLLWGGLHAVSIITILGAMVAVGLLGLWDDWHKVYRQKGISASAKFRMQWLIALSAVALLVWCCKVPMSVTLPFCTTYSLPMWLLYILWAAFIVVGTSNAVNLTDGLDGLVSFALIPNFLFFSCMGILISLFAPEVVGSITQESALLAVFSAGIAGSLVGFLWHNAYPASVFMGDVGSLSLGAGLALIALVMKSELLLPLTGIVFVTETSSVMLQVLSVRYRGKRFFKMSPIHHHFELAGMHEQTITLRAGIITVLACSLVLWIMMSIL